MPLPPPQRVHRRVRRAGLCVGALVGVGAVLASCSTPAPAHHDSVKLLGQEAGTPAATGQPVSLGGGTLSAVSCAGSRHCWAVGLAGVGPTPTVVVATSDGGRTWAPQSLGAAAEPNLTDISCPVVTACMAVGSVGANPPTGTVEVTRDGGRTWTAAAVPPGALDVTSVWCSTPVDCTVVISDGTLLASEVTQDGGQTWTREGNLPDGLEDPGRITCDTAGTCLVAGNVPTGSGRAQGAIAVSSDGGSTWQSASLPSSTGLLQDAVCGSAVGCIAVGTTSTTASDVVPAQGAVLFSSDNGMTWHAGPTPPVEDVFAVECPGAALCVMAGTQWVTGTSIGTGGIGVSHDGGATFTSISTAYTPLSLTALACPSVAQCIAVGGDTVARIHIPTSRATTTKSPRGHVTSHTHRPAS
ncbi:MAG TPA: sialidase family protein [Acidimicrobiales bacterium]|nr:sialidase family protein [Acidimicrobiales bacterium]